MIMIMDIYKYGFQQISKQNLKEFQFIALLQYQGDPFGSQQRINFHMLLGFFFGFSYT